MAQTIIGLNDAKAVKRYSGFLAVDVPRESYFGRKFMGDGADSSMPIQRLTQLESDQGEQITYDLSMAMRMQPVEGDNTLENKEEDLRFFTDAVYIDQMRGGVNTGGKMTRKRTLHDLRKVARKRQTEWWARVFDELMFMYLSGERGQNSDYIFPTTYTGFANNSLSAPDGSHHLFANTALGISTTTAGSIGDDVDFYPQVKDFEYIAAYLKSLGGGTSGVPAMQPIKIDGEGNYVAILSPFGAYSLRTSASTGAWLDIQKALATAVGKDSNIFKGGQGMINKIVIHDHPAVIEMDANDSWGTTTATAYAGNAARGLILGQQAAVIAFGSPGSGMRFDWHEEERDNGNQAIITTSAIFGIKKTTFNSLDFGVLAYDYYDAR